MPFTSHSEVKSSKFFLISGSFKFFGIGVKSSCFSKILISFSVRSFLLKLKTVLEQKYPIWWRLSEMKYPTCDTCSHFCFSLKSETLAWRKPFLANSLLLSVCKWNSLTQKVVSLSDKLTLCSKLIKISRKSSSLLLGFWFKVFSALLLSLQDVKSSDHSFVICLYSPY